MKKFYAIGLALLSALAFSAFATASAFAEEPVWLVKGVAVTSSVETESSGELTLIHLAGGFLEPEAVIKCSGVFDGTVGSKGADTVTKLLTLGGAEVTLSSLLECTNVKNCASPLVAAEHLPWTTQLSLMTNGKILDKFTAGTGGLPAYFIECMSIKITTECEGTTSSTVALVGSSLEGTFVAKEIEEEGEEGKCGTHEKVALQEGKGVITIKGKPTEEIDVSEM